MDELYEFGRKLAALGEVVEDNMSKLVSFGYLGEKWMTLVACFQRNWVRLQEAEDMVDEFD